VDNHIIGLHFFEESLNSKVYTDFLKKHISVIIRERTTRFT